MTVTEVGRHHTKVMRSGEGVVGVCSCKHRQMKPVSTRQEAEDWTRWHLDQVVRAQADPGKQLSSAQYLAYLREKAADSTLSKSDRELFKMLADEYERMSRTAPPRGGRPQTPNAKYNTGVETEPLW